MVGIGLWFALHPSQLPLQLAPVRHAPAVLPDQPELSYIKSMTENASSHPTPSAVPNDAPQKVLTPEAQRALAEAEARRALYEKAARDAAQQKEIDGRGGLEPVRYGDWEIKGLTSDF